MTNKDISKTENTMLHDWETVGRSNNRELTERMRVNGGWIYRTVVWSTPGGQVTVAMVFVSEADPLINAL